jgi:hypothetical protein
MIRMWAGDGVAPAGRFVAVPASAESSVAIAKIAPPWNAHSTGSKAAGRIPMCWWSAAGGIQEANSNAADSQAGHGVAGDRCGWIAVSAVRCCGISVVGRLRA